MLTFKRKIIVCITALSVIFAAALVPTRFAQASDPCSGCPAGCPDYNTPILDCAISALKTAWDNILDAIDEALGIELKLHGDRLISALKVMTAQKEVAAQQISVALATQAANIAEALEIQAQSERVKKARVDYGPEFGQGTNPCGRRAVNLKIAADAAQVPEAVRRTVISEIDAAPGRYDDPSKAMAEMLKEHKELFCTEDQSAAGMCEEKERELAGANLNAATLFTLSMPDEPLHRAKISFINNLAGLPDPNIQVAQGKTPAAEAYLTEKARRDAIISPAYTALKDIQIDTSGTASPESSGIPIAMMFDKEVRRYFGNTEEYTAWNQRLAGQKPRGVLIDILHIKALQLAIEARHYQQLERQEAILAALMASNVRKMNEGAQANAQQALGENIRSQIR